MKNLTELVDLINVRQYVANAADSMTLPKQTVNELGKVKILIDNKIIDILKGSEFKTYIGYENVDKAVQEFVNNTNIKAGLKK